MSTVTGRESIVFTPQAVRDARRMAEQTRRSVTEVLEDQLALEPAAFMEVLGSMLHYPVFSMDGLNRLTPSFEDLTFAESAEWECIALRDERGELYLIMSDPFTSGNADLAGTASGVQFHWGLAHRSDVAAYLAHHEKSLNAMEACRMTSNVPSSIRTRRWRSCRSRPSARKPVSSSNSCIRRFTMR